MAPSGDHTVPPEVTQKANDETLSLSFTEAAQVYAVITAIMDKLSLVGVIALDPQEQAMVLTQSVGEEISSMISQQRELEKRFEALIKEQHALRNAPNKNKKLDNDANVKLVAEQLRVSIKQLCDKLKDNPNVVENMAKVAAERQQFQALLNRCLEELQALGRLPCITETVYGERHRRQEMRDMVERERTTTRTVTQLRLDLRDEKEQHEKAMRVNRARVAKLKEEIKLQNKATYIEQVHTQKMVDATNERCGRLEDRSIADLAGRLDSLQRQILLEECVHQAAGDYFKTALGEMRDLSVSWGDRAKTDANAKESMIEELRARHKAALAEFKETERLYTRELELKQERDGAAREKAVREEAARALAVVQGHAAARIQAFWRGRMVRQAAKGGKAGKKGKGKKKK